MSGFDFPRLRRYPDVEAPNLQAWDATDELLVRWALDAEVPGDRITVIGDEYGAITLALADAGVRSVRVHQDLATGRQALTRNAEAFGLSGTFEPHELGPDLLAEARLVLVQLPKALAEWEEIADAVARWAAPDVTLVAGGRVKHMTLAQNDVLAKTFHTVQAQRAERKSRLVVASGPRDLPGAPPFPVSQRHGQLTLCAFGGAFAGAKLDIGTRVLIDAMPGLLAGLPAGSAVDEPSARLVVDLGCGTGALAATFAVSDQHARVIATDRSASAVRSAHATMTAMGLTDRVTVTLDDAGAGIPDASIDLVLLNPPFHLGASVHEGAGRRLIDAAARMLRQGGEVWTVFNSHLDHRSALQRAVGPTEQMLRTPKFTVTRSVRRG